MSASSTASGDHPIVRARWVVLALFVGLCAWLIPGVGSIQNDDDVLAFLPPDHPDVVAFKEVAETFGMLEVALVGLEDGGADLLDRPHIEAVRELTEDLNTVPGVRVAISFPDLPNPVLEGETLKVGPLVPGVRENVEPEPIEAVRERVLASRDAVGNFISEDGEAASIIVFLLPREDASPESFTARREALAKIREHVAEGWKGTAYFGGGPYMEMEASESSRRDIEGLSPIVIGVLALASAVLLGSLTAAVVNLLVTGLGVGLIMGGHGTFAEPLTIVSSSTPVMMVALGGAFGVHMLAGYQRQEGSSRERASGALRELWLPVLLSGATTSVAFFALIVMPQVPMQRFGIVAGIGVLLLLVLALLVLPALLAVLPDGLLRHRPERPMPLRMQPPKWVLAALTVGGVALASRMEADPDTSNVFDPDSSPRAAFDFFDDHFEGSTFLQITVEGELRENEVIRRIRNIVAEVSQVEGVADVRGVHEIMAMLNEADGGRRGVPENPGAAKSVLKFLIGHPAMAQLMTIDASGAVIHVKLSPVDGAGQARITDEVRAIVERHRAPGDILHVAKTSDPAVAEKRAQDVVATVARATGRTISLADLEGAGGANPEFLKEITKLRDEIFDVGMGFVPEGIVASEVTGLKPEALVKPRGADLEAVLEREVPSLSVAKDRKKVAKFLGLWIDKAAPKFETADQCGQLGFAPEDCAQVNPLLAELQDEEWVVAEGGGETREVPMSLAVTGQPVIGLAFAESVTSSLLKSTAVSLGALALVLLLSGNIFALLPAVWTLTVTAGVIALLGHPISVGTSMVACIALGAGVDFAIHLGYRAKERGGDGQRAVDELGAVILVSATQLAFAFSVLALSQMPPLQQFGIGLSVGLVGAALGAVWLTPLLKRVRRA